MSLSSENLPSPIYTYRCTVAYDGSLFYGWQKTKTGPSIQQSLEDALLQLTQEKSSIEAASRTDRGVHAEGQVIAFSLSKKWATEKLQKGLNAWLPSEIRLLSIEIMEKNFHPTLDAKEKEYHYRLCCGPIQNPIHRLYSWHFRHPLDQAKMEKGAKDLLGTHDFSSFCNEREKNPICHLKKIQISSPSPGRLQISLMGNRFLYKMARTLTGTLVYIGAGKLSEDCIPQLIRSSYRPLAGITAPPLGLFLHRVFYDIA